VSVKEIFPHVVKNVVTKNAELKKLVYLYLLRYAEQEPDLILLSISTFQRSLKDPNPLIRASALRVLSSIRVNIIAPIMYISIKDCANDMSPYVRKTAAHAIPKLFALEPEMREDIVMLIDKLLDDKTSLVLSSAVAAFEEVCPDRLDLIHPNYRKFVALMADFDEWGQVILINLLIRYGRTQFINPNLAITNEDHNSDSDYGESYALLDQDHRALLRNAKPLLQSRNSAVVMAVVQLYLYLAPRAELNSIIARPLLRLLHSHQEIQIVILSNVATLTNVWKDQDHAAHNFNGNSTENIDHDNTNATKLTGSFTLKHIFEPFLKSFFIKSRDSTHIKILKLKIITNLSSSTNIALILREFQAYINNYQDEMEFVSATIEAIGKCASRIKEIAPICLSGLILLLSNRNESIIAQSIIVLRSQIIDKYQSSLRAKEKQELKIFEESNKDNVESNKKAHDEDGESEADEDEESERTINLVIRQVSKLIVDKIKTPPARATILWILAEFCDKNKKAYECAPDILRMIARSFINEADVVKLQAINLAAKVYVTIALESQTSTQNTIEECFSDSDRERVRMFVNYIFNLAKYDLNYDVRDRARFLKQLISNSEQTNDIRLIKQILMSPKNTLIASQKNQSNDNNEEFSASFEFGNSSRFRIGTLSHFLTKPIPGYEELPDFPSIQPDSSVRRRADEESQSKMVQQLFEQDQTSNGFRNKAYTSSLDSESSGSEDSDDDSSSSDESSSDSRSEQSSESESGSDTQDSDESSDEDETKSTKSKSSDSVPTTQVKEDAKR
jgi:AP-3 complex subunit beta